MTIYLGPEVVDHLGFRRRSWSFDHQGQTYFLQQTDGPLVVLHETDGGWKPVEGNEAGRIIKAFERELAEQES